MGTFASYTTGAQVPKKRECKMFETATCSIKLPEGIAKWIQLIPAGNIQAVDGRKWINDNLEAVIETSMAGVDLVIDYEHQTDYAKENGKPAPAAGWIKKLEARADSIWGMVEWTEKAKAHFGDKEYRYLSPTFYHTKDGHVTRIVRAALTNNPAIHELPALANNQPNGELKKMEAFLKALASALGLAADADQETVTAAIMEMTASKSTATSELTTAICSALEIDEGANIEVITAAISGLKAAKASADESGEPDPAKFVSMAAYEETSTQLKNLQETVSGDKAETAVEKAMAEGKLAPAQKDWAISFAAKDPDGFNKFIEGQPVVVDPNAEEAGKTPALATKLNDEQKAICSATGVSEEAFLKTLNAGKE